VTGDGLIVVFFLSSLPRPPSCKKRELPALGARPQLAFGLDFSVPADVPDLDSSAVERCRALVVGRARVDQAEGN